MAFTRPNESVQQPQANITAPGAAPRRAVQHSGAPSQALTTTTGEDIFQFVAGGEDIVITLDDIKSYLCPAATDQECVLFGKLCATNKLNPWLKDAYLIKYDKNSAAAMVTGKNAYMKRAEEHPQFDGLEAGVKVFDPQSGTIEYREGAAYYPKMGEELIGGWAKVYRKDRSRPYYEEVALGEYDKGQSKWKDSPATMIRKVALVHALREAFPSNIQGMYDADEVSYQADIELTAREVSEYETHSRRSKGAARAQIAPPAVVDPLADIEADGPDGGGLA